MLHNYIQTAFRNLRRNGYYLAINVVGLGCALGFCILSYLNYRFAHTYDHWHTDADRIGRIEMQKSSNKAWYGSCPSALAAAVETDLPGVESSLRYDALGSVVKHGESVFNEVVHVADEHFFSFFDFEVLAGVADLSDRDKVIIDAETAEKYFGAENPIGQTLMFNADTDKKMPLVIGAVLKNIPLNSSVRFHFLTHLDNAWSGGERLEFDNWKRSAGAIFLKLKSPSGFPTVQNGLQAYLAPRNAARPDWQVDGFRLSPLRDIALDSRDLRGNMLWQGLPPAAVWGNIAMSLMLLLTAALNFSNMTISISNRRLREMGVRKVLGGSQFQLMRQMLAETFVVVFLATLFAMLLAYPIVDWHNRTWTFTDLKVNYQDVGLLGFLALVALGTTLLAGSYPAFFVSGFRPARIFRGGALFLGKNHFSKIMLGLQMAISVLTMVVGFSFAHNAERNQNADIGFDHRPVLQAWMPKVGDYQVFENAIRDIPGIEQTAASLHLPYFGFMRSDFTFQEQSYEASVYDVGNDFGQLMNMRLTAGNWPLPAGDTTTSPEILLNEKLVGNLGLENQAVIGQTITLARKNYRVAGIVRDFMTDSPFDNIAPSILKTIPNRDCRRALIKTKTLADQPQIMAAIEQKWRELFPFTPFNVGYQSEMLKEAIEVSANIARTSGVLSILAVLLSAAGLFSLVSLEALRRMRELAIRRVVGASSGQVGWILQKNYIWVFALGLLIGCAGGWFLAKSLMDSIFQTNFGVPAWALLMSSFGMVALALVTIGVKIWQTLRINPAVVLRGE